MSLTDILCKRKRHLFALIISNRNLYFKINSHLRGLHTTEKYNGKLSHVVGINILPHGNFHIGNYFTSIKPSIDLQKQGLPLSICIADLQTLSLVDHNTYIRRNILLTTALLLACGVDPNKSVIFQQSRIPQNSQLDWIISCLNDKNIPFSIPEHKKKISSIKEPSLGQYVDPIMFSTHYLLHNASLIAAGVEHHNHIKFVQDIAKKFEKLDVKFISPKHFATKDKFYLNFKNLRQPTENMPTLSSDTKSLLNILDPEDIIREHCRKAVTDFTSSVYFDMKRRPGISNLMMIHRAVTGKDFVKIQKENRHLESAQYKMVVADAVNNYFLPIRTKVEELMMNEEYLTSVLNLGAEKAIHDADKTLQIIYDKIGFNHPKKFSSQRTDGKTSLLESVSKSVEDDMKKKYVFSGIQPTGVLHLGNYFGAVKQWADLQNEGHDVTICVVDQHAITVPQNSRTLPDNILAMIASIIACGVDPKHSIIFQQSKVAEHAQLNVLLRSVAHVALLSRQAHYKDKLTSLDSTPSLGLFSYPVLQAADILLYKTSHVPVGDDQKQHIQVARQIARQFNKRYGNVFRLPTAIILDESSARLKSLQEPMKKMSKSEANANGRIEILDSAESIIKKFNKAKVETSKSSKLGVSSHDVGIANMMAIHSFISGDSTDRILEECSHRSVDEYKSLVADTVIEHLKPMKIEADKLLSDKTSLLLLMENGANQARLRAMNTIQTVHDKIGLNLG